MRRTFATLWLLLACMLVSALAFADTRYLIEQLRTSDDYRVRTQAALALGASGDDAAVRPLCDALGDSNISVKVAAAAALGKLGKPAGVPCLEAARARDGSSALRAQIDKSLSQLGGGGGGAIAAGTKYYVAIAITNKTKRPTAEIEGIVRSAMQAKLQSVSGFAVAPKSESPSQGGQIVKSKRLKGFYLLATVEAPVYAGGSLTQVVRLSMFTYPDKALRGETPVKLTQSDTPSKDVESENVLMKMCSENAVANFQKVINTL